MAQRNKPQGPSGEQEQGQSQDQLEQQQHEENAQSSDEEAGRAQGGGQNVAGSTVDIAQGYPYGLKQDEDVDPDEMEDYVIVAGMHDFGMGDVGSQGEVVKLSAAYAARFPGKFKSMKMVEAERKVVQQNQQLQDERAKEQEQLARRQGAVTKVAMQREQQDKEQRMRERADRVRQQEEARREAEERNANASKIDRSKQFERTGQRAGGASSDAGIPPTPPTNPAQGSGVPGPGGAATTSNLQTGPA
jgi:hypothetical protein